MQKEGGKRQLLVIDPKSELSFHGPYDQVVTEYFTLQNPTESPIAFKVKTTAPKRYCVRPNNGMVPPHGKVQVNVMLQPGDLSQEKNKHKFMIQSAVATSNTTNIDELFKSISAEEIMDSKFKCVFADVPGGLKSSSSSSNAGVNAVSSSVVNNNNTTNENHNNHHSGDNGESVKRHYPHHPVEDLDHMVSATGEEVSSALRFADQSSTTTTSATATSGATTSARTGNTVRYNDSYATTAGGDRTRSEPQDAEKELKLAQDEIRDLKEKLQQVQRYASRNVFSAGGDGDSASQSAASAARQAATMATADPPTQLYQYAAVVVLIGIIIGYLMGKLV